MIQTMPKSCARCCLSFVIALTAACSAAALTVPGTDFPYLTARLYLPPQDNPFPGLGYNYSALSKGIETLKWNPAGLTDLKHAQSYLSVSQGNAAPEYTRKFETGDQTQTFSSNNPFSVNYFITSQANATTLATREHTAHVNYENAGAGFNFGQAVLVNDWLTLGILSQGRTGADLNIIGQFPTTAKTQADFTSASNLYGTSMSIDANGYLSVVLTEEGNTFTWTTQEKLWDGFLHQTSAIPLTVVSNLTNSISVNPGVTFGGAAKWQKISGGLAFTPISGSCNVNNSLRAVINDGTADGFIYSPNFDPGNTASAGEWLYNPDLYGTESGYIRSVVNVPAGESIAEARYQGFYAASAVRSDLGLKYEVNDNLTIGLAMENFGGAALNFTGAGRVAYVNSRVSTEEPSGFNQLPTEENPLEWNLFKDTFSPVSGTEKYFLQENVNVSLPKRLRIGLSLVKPFLLAIDYEQNQTPVIYIDQSQNRTITISNLANLRLGTEMRILSLPVIWRNGLNFIFKPTLAGLTASEQSSLDKAFQFGLLPAGLTEALEIQLFDTTIGLGIGLQPLMLLQAYQLDVLNQEMAALSYYNLSASRGQWKVDYNSAVDAGASASAYSNRVDQKTRLGLEHLRWLQTISISYTF